jgi:Mrp family chromosome partitioning ATPase
VPPDAGEFVATRVLSELLGALHERFDVVLIDAPPLLHVGDAMVLSAKVDAIIVVARINLLRRPMLAEVRRLLESSPAQKLGFVVTGAQADDDYSYHGGGYYHRAAAEQEPVA